MIGKEQRNNSLDLFRVICIFMVVSMHYFSWGGLIDAAETSKINLIIGSGISVFSRSGVNGFFLLSGFYITNMTTINVKKVFDKPIALWRKVVAYSVGLFLIASVFSIYQFSLSELIKSFFPILTNEYWFFSVFIVVSIVKPFLGRLLTNCSEREVYFLAVSLFVIDTIPPIIGFNPFSNLGYGLLHAFDMVIIGYALKFIVKADWIGKWKCLAIYLFGGGLSGAFSMMEKYVFHQADIAAACYNSPFIVLATCGLFIFFYKLKISWKWSSIISGNVFAVYLLNDNKYIRDFLWQKVYQNSRFYASNLMIVHYMASTVLFVIIAIAIDCLLSHGPKTMLKIMDRKEKTN